MNDKIDVGVIGGSGFYKFLDDMKEIKIETPYGAPSDFIAIGTINNKKVAFIPRHGRSHTLPPHMIPYQANIWALKSIGVKSIIAPTAVGSLQPNIKPGDFVVSDQFVDRTCGRKDTFFDGPVATHIMGADPYCNRLRALAIDTIKSHNITVHDTGTVVVIQGPRFSTRAESIWFTKMGWACVNMTQYPEVILSRELEMCYVNISVITDWDAGCLGIDGAEPVTADEVQRIFASNNEKLQRVIIDMIKNMSNDDCSECPEAMRYARL